MVTFTARQRSWITVPVMPSRVWLIAAIALLVVALRTNRRRLLVIAAGCLLLAVVLAGVQPLPGQLTAVVAAVLLALWVPGESHVPVRRTAEPLRRERGTRARNSPASATTVRPGGRRRSGPRCEPGVP
jgi:hypothetical protein